MRSTVGTQVHKLLNAGMLQEEQTQRSGKAGVGRPGSALELNPEHRSFIGVDLGVGHVRGMLIDLAGNTISEIAETIPAKDQSPQRTSQMVAKILARLSAQATTLDGAMISVPGLVNTSGTIVRLPLLNWQDVQFRDLLRKDLPDFGTIHIDNDANIFAKSELLGTDEHDRSVIYFWVDAGIGAGIVVNNTLLAGANGQAGEIGHIFARAPSGQMRARLDDVAGAPAILAQAQNEGLAIQTTADLVAKIDEGDQSALKILSDWTDVMSETFSSLASIFDAKSMILSGPLTAFLRRALPDIEQKTRDLLYHGTVMPSFVLGDYHAFQLAQSCASIQRNAFLKGDRV
jgi:predicted NBD/HSP70 family sugar kinase